MGRQVCHREESTADSAAAPVLHGSPKRGHIDLHKGANRLGHGPLMISMPLVHHGTMVGRGEQRHMALRVSMTVTSLAAHPCSKRQP